jgi:hypothetical protein
VGEPVPACGLLGIELAIVAPLAWRLRRARSRKRPIPA